MAKQKSTKMNKTLLENKPGHDIRKEICLTCSREEQEEKKLSEETFKE